MQQIRQLKFPGQYFQGEKALQQLPEILKKLGKKALIVSTKRYEDELTDTLSLPIELFKGQCTYAEIKRLKKIAINYDVLVVVGGGKVIDCGKVVADHLEIPLVVVPAIASTDAPCTSCAVIYDENNEIVDYELQKKPPAVVLVDVGLLLKSPVRFFISGMADALSTGFEASAWLQSNNLSYHGGAPSITGIILA